MKTRISRYEIVIKYTLGVFACFFVVLISLSCAEPGVEFALTCVECFAPDDSIFTLMIQPFFAGFTALCVGVAFWSSVIAVAIPSIARDDLKKCVVD